MGECAEDDQEDDEAGDPAVKLVGVHDFVAEQGDDECCSCDDDNTSPAWNVGIHSVEDLSAYNDVDGRPAYTGQDIEKRNCRWLDTGAMRDDHHERHTELDAIISVKEPREHHLAQSKPRSKSGEEADGSDSQDVDEENGQDGVHEAQAKDGKCQRTDGKGRDDHVGSEPLSESTHQRCNPSPPIECAHHSSNDV